MDKITVAQIQEHRDHINTLSDTKNDARHKRDKEVSHLKYDVYQEQIRALERERDDIVDKVTKEHDSIITEIDTQIQEQYLIIAQAKRILSYLKLDTIKDLTISDDDIELSRNVEQHQEPLGYLYDDDYLKVKAFIIGNRKPKNKYSLVAVGKSIFTEDIIKYPYSYGMDIYNHGRYFSLQLLIKDSSSVGELISYFNKHTTTILKNIVSEYETVKAEYIEVLQAYSIADFTDIITWQCPKCAHFHTIFDDFRGGYIPQCSKHDPYIDMVSTQVLITG